MKTLGPEQLGDYPRHFSSPNATMSECALQSKPCVNSTLRWLVSPGSATAAHVQLLNKQLSDFTIPLILQPTYYPTTHLLTSCLLIAGQKVEETENVPS